MFGKKSRELQAQVEAQATRVAELEQQVLAQDRAGVSSSDRENMMELFNAPNSYAGPMVNAQTAMKASAVYACVSLLAGAIASLPIPVYERTEQGRQRADHPIWYLLNEQPTPTFSAFAMWEYLISCKALRGDSYAWLLRNAAGVVQEIIPMPWTQTIVERRNGRNTYYVELEGKYYGLDQDDVLHFHSLGFDGVKSPSVIGLAGRQSIGVALAAEEYSARFFSNGARPDIAIKHPGSPNPEQARLMRELWMERHQGVRNAHMPAMLTGGADITQLTMSAEDSQLLETRRWQVVDIARLFGIPAHMIGEHEKSSSWGSGIEQMSIGFVRWTLNRHLVPIQQELNRKVWPGSPRYFVEYNREGLLSGDSKAESEYLAKALGGPGAQGYMTINEVRRIKNLPPIEGGDMLYRTEKGDEEQAAAAASGQPEGTEEV